MPDAKPALADTGQGRQFLTFRIDARVYAVAAEEVSEVIRAPAVARVPQAPKGLLGLANLRGTVLPIASLRGLLGRTEPIVVEQGRVIVLAGSSPIGLSVDAVDALVSVATGEIETRQAELAQQPGEDLTGAFRAGAADVARILDLPALLAKAFTPRVRAAGAAIHETATSLAQIDETGRVDEKLVSFEVAGQEFALSLGSVREIVQAPASATDVPHSETLVLGVMSYRDTLLPLLSLRGLLGFTASRPQDDAGKVIVTAVGGVLVGLVADRMRAIVPADPALIEPTPPMLAARTGGETQIKAIYRGDGGRRLISILAADRLFREDVMARLGSAGAATAGPLDATADGDETKVLVFRLGDDEFGLPIEVVDEVARAPEQVTRLPKTPAFLEGVINLRGEVLPVIDQRRRFDMPPPEALEGRRLIVVRTEAHRAGLIVDSVSEVLRCATSQILPAPELAGETTRLVNGVLNLEKDQRLILMLDPDELLSRAERGLLAAFQARVEQAEA
jgi:purine-binding chemotaxis protein CheW